MIQLFVVRVIPKIHKDKIRSSPGYPRVQYLIKCSLDVVIFKNQEDIFGFTTFKAMDGRNLEGSTVHVKMSFFVLSNCFQVSI